MPGLKRWSRLAFGLILTASPAAAAEKAPAPTYHKEIARILQKHCQDCHRPGQVAPFSLLSYEHAKKRATDLAEVAEARTMPPWPASTKDGGPFRDARVMSPEEIATLTAWVEAGAPEGNPADAPEPRSFPSEWPLGTPDLVLEMPEPYTVGAEGRDEHRVFVIPTNLPEGKWISAIDFRPGSTKVVHHVLCAFDTLGRARRLDEADPKPGYAVFGGFNIIPTGGLGGWAPGKLPVFLPDGGGRYLPAKSDILLQVHYHKSGKAETDATRIGLYFAKAPVDKLVRGGMVVPPRGRGIIPRPSLSIPAGEANHPVTGTMTIERDAHLIAVIPHMHWLGKDFVMKANLPDGTSRTLIRIDRWDFNWQGTYDFVSPIALPKGTRLEMIAHFDNSEGNPSNPSKPPVTVGWGEQTTDEMCIGFLQMTYDDEHLGNRPPARFLSEQLTGTAREREKP